MIVRRATLLVAVMVVAGIAHAECDKLAITDAKALTQEQLKRCICRDMTKRNSYVDSANSFLTHTDMVFDVKGVKFTNRGAFYGAWLAELKQAAACNEAVKSNTETYRDLYADSPGCEEPHVAERLEFMP